MYTFTVRSPDKEQTNRHAIGKRVHEENNTLVPPFNVHNPSSRSSPALPLDLPRLGSIAHGKLTFTATFRRTLGLHVLAFRSSSGTTCHVPQFSRSIGFNHLALIYYTQRSQKWNPKCHGIRILIFLSLLLGLKEWKRESPVDEPYKPSLTRSPSPSAYLSSHSLTTSRLKHGLWTSRLVRVDSLLIRASNESRNVEAPAPGVPLSRPLRRPPARGFRCLGGALLPRPDLVVETARATNADSGHLEGLRLDSVSDPAAGERELVHVSLNMTLHRVGAAINGVSAIAGAAMGTLARAAYDDCMELLEDSADQLSNSLLVVSPSAARASSSSQARVKGASDEDVRTWLSAALTNQDTCSEGLQQVKDLRIKAKMETQLKDLTELVSNCLAIFSGVSRNRDFDGIPIHDKKRRKLLNAVAEDEFPAWLGKKDRRLLQVPATNIQADMVVSKDGNGTYTSIADAVKAAPEYSTRRIIIYIKAGRYDENIKVGRKKTNLMFVGDGKTQTIIAGSRSVYDNFTTFHTATFAATGTGFIMRDITIQNWAGPEKHQAVALRVGADHAVVYRCNVIGYQDTLYVHSQRQFFRECDIYGTVDFIFGNAAVVLQNCSLWARKPMPMQKNTITAQNRKDPNQNTGISIHACRVVAASDLEPVKSNYSTYLGRPWKLYSRTVYMMSYFEDHVHQAGWLEWNATFALDTLYYGEYMNYGPGAAVGKRVTWPGFRVITLPAEASKFTVAQFIFGSSWLPSTGVAFLAGLSV
ncbi:hypothetical protein Cni_G10922 [Canna indica]|uniref:Pectinesterase inhibitor domain-containing protein n=1 Tax=Canna indica TaxID=4628 RepID=A0AAQ3QAR5_9LILI|nr:hypothetical protein Cni_G10922 [Canna indica]